MYGQDTSFMLQYQQQMKDEKRRQAKEKKKEIEEKAKLMKSNEVSAPKDKLEAEEVLKRPQTHSVFTEEMITVQQPLPPSSDSADDSEIDAYDIEVISARTSKKFDPPIAPFPLLIDSLLNVASAETVQGAKKIQNNFQILSSLTEDIEFKIKENCKLSNKIQMKTQEIAKDTHQTKLQIEQMKNTKKSTFEIVLILLLWIASLLSKVFSGFRKKQPPVHRQRRGSHRKSNADALSQ